MLPTLLLVLMGRAVVSTATAYLIRMALMIPELQWRWSPEARLRITRPCIGDIQVCRWRTADSLKVFYKRIGQALRVIKDDSMRRTTYQSKNTL